MATTKVISGNVIKNDGGTSAFAGTIVHPRMSVLSQITMLNAPYKGHIGPPQLSGANVGTIKPIAAGTFNNMEKGSYIAQGGLTTRIAGVANTSLRSTGSISPATRDNGQFAQYERVGVGTWDIHGVLTKGGEAGTVILASGIDNVVGNMADHGPKKPGEFAFNYGAPLPKQADFGNP